MEKYLPESESSMIVDIKNLTMTRCEEVYEMEEIIGSGTFSDVVRGVHKGGKKYAIKIIDKAKLKTPKQKWRIQNEIALHKRSNHNYVVKLVDFYESDVDICLVLELCEGGELFNRIVERGCFSEKDSSRVIRQTCSALQHLHSLGIVHRDIKPENILFVSSADESDVKLADFGLAKQQDTVTPKGRSFLKASTSGTTAYCAPERLNQLQESKAVDMWSIGCIMYFLLFGVPPFYSTKEDEDEHDTEICEAVNDGKIEFERHSRTISTMARDLLLRLLEGDPSKRITADEVLLHPWIKNTSLSQQQVQASDQAMQAKAHEIGRNLLKSSINRVIDYAAVKQDSNEN